MFIEIKKDILSGRIICYNKYDKNKLSTFHQRNLDFIAWLKCGRIGTKFYLTTSKENVIYIKIDNLDDAKIKTLMENI